MQDEPTVILPITRERSCVIRGTSCSARRNCRTDLYVALIVCGTLLVITCVSLLTIVMIFAENII